MTGRFPRFALAGLAALGLAFGVAAFFAWIGGGDSPPSFAEVRAAHRSSEAWLLDRRGEVLHVRRLDPHGRRLEWTPLPALSPALVRTVLQTEDKRFYRHGGVDGLAVGAALRDGLVSGRLRGASTITMQLASRLSPAGSQRAPVRRWKQKVRQVRSALQIEQTWTKDEILEAYLNLVTFRGELQGIAAASRCLFGKTPDSLDGTESLVLASLIPSAGSSPDRAALRARRHACAAAPSCAGEDIQALVRDLLARPCRIRPETRLAPHVAQALLREADARVRTTLDRDLQARACELLNRHLEELAGRNVRDGAVLVVENRTGQVLAYVGSRGDAASAPAVDGVRALRQAGSTLKPFLYGLALEKKILTAASVILDAPVQVGTPGGLYVPENYDRDYGGPVTVRTALASSLNMPAVRVLLLTGIEPLVARLRDLGCRSVQERPDFYGYSLALGSADVSLWELVGAYRALANGGQAGPLAIAFGRKEPGRQVMDRRAAYIVASILSDRESRSGTFGLENVLATRYWTAVKTGTSKDMRDNWCVGFSEAFTVGVWVGNFSGEPMWNVTGISGAAPVWLDLMNTLHRVRPSRPPAPPPGLRERWVAVPGLNEPARREWFVAGTEPAGESVAPVRGPARPRIAYPVDGSVIALDQDIPPGHERILLQAVSATPACQWLLNGEFLGAAQDVLWRPVRGRHALCLADEEGQTLDAVTFVVR